MTFDPNQLWSAYGEIVIASAFNVLAAAAILIFGVWIANSAGGAMRAMARRHPRIDDTLAAFFSWIVRYGLIAFVIVAVLNRFGVATTSIVAVLGAGALAIGLALQGTLSNVAAGVMLMLFRPYRLGDFVELAERRGTVEDVNLFTTEIITPRNVKIILPNSLCWSAPISNYSAHKMRRIDISYGVAYDTDLDHAIAVLENVLAAEPLVLDAPAPSVQVDSLGDFAIGLEVRAWVATANYIAARFALNKAVKEALDANGVTIPFPTSMNYEVRLPPPAEKTTPKLKPRGAGAPRGVEESGGD